MTKKNSPAFGRLFFRIAAGAVFSVVTLMVFSAIAEQLVGDGSTYWSVTKDTADTVVTFDNGSSTTTPMLVPACSSCLKGHETKTTGGKRYKSAVIEFHGDETCCWSLQWDATVASNEIGGVPGACLKGHSGMTLFDRPDRDLLLLSQPTYSGICTNAPANDGDTLYAACANDADCTPFGATIGACDLTPSGDLVSNVGAVFVCEGTAEVTLRKQVVRR